MSSICQFLKSAFLVGSYFYKFANRDKQLTDRRIWTQNVFANYTVSQKKQSKLFSSELRQISINFDNFWQKDGEDDEIMWGALIFHLT